MGIDEEAALIVYDPQAKMQHFIRQANFRTDAAYFGFLVPTPTMPQLAEVGDSLFGGLQSFTLPETRTQVVWRDRSLFEWGVVRTTFVAGAVADRATPQAVEVLDQQKVAGMEATILRATDAKKLREWLNQHGYEARPALTEWLRVYVDQGWYLTAFQYKKSNDKAPKFRSRAVRISFATDTPFYPYREPADSRENAPSGPRTLRLFYATTDRVSGHLGTDGTWPGRTVWSAPLSGSQKETLQRDLTDPRSDAKLSATPVELPETLWLTEFEDTASPRPGTDEVFFQKSDSQENVKRPPYIVNEYRDRINPREITAVSVILGTMLLGVGFLTLRYLCSPAPTT
jgi:hypothetical protein